MHTSIAGRALLASVLITILLALLTLIATFFAHETKDQPLLK